MCCAEAAVRLIGKLAGMGPITNAFDLAEFGRIQIDLKRALGLSPLEIRIQACEHESPWVRVSSLHLVNAETLFSVIREDRVWWVRRSAAYRLRDVSHEYVGQLFDLYSGEVHEDVRREIVCAMGRCNSYLVLNAQLLALADESPVVRAAAALALEDRENQEVLHSLMHCAALDECHHVRECASVTLRKLMAKMEDDYL